jgi:hypothetical protein
MEKVCVPVPIGAGTPADPDTVNCHCVPDGVKTALLASVIVNEPLIPREAVWNDGTVHGVADWPLHGGGMVGVIPEGISCAWTVPFE